jgi:high affinity Mn2+ porin
MQVMKFTLFALALMLSLNLLAQEPNIPDSLQNLNTNFHFQLTTVTQHKNSIHAPYTGTNSLTGPKENATTLTATIFWGLKLWKDAAIYINPEIAGGSGVSSAHGIAGFTNGEAFRVGDPSPTIYLGRAFFQQTINFGNEKEFVGEGANDVYKTRSYRYFDIIVGKFSIADYFDLNTYSHDPRSQFFNWSLMSNGAWDYPANVRGYTWGVVLEYGTRSWKARAASVLVPTTANGNIMDTKYGKANSSVLEFEKTLNWNGKSGAIRFLWFYTQTQMGNYQQAIQQNPAAPDVTSTRKYGRTKYGYGINLEQDLGKGVGFFARTSWNDGKNETWAFTEIDRSLSGGISIQGNNWRRKNDELGIGSALNGLSADHSNYLASGGYGFIIGDGKLNYGKEWIIEAYYKANLFSNNFFLTPDFQYVMNPAYNKDRGPAFISAIRVHVQF